MKALKGTLFIADNRNPDKRIKIIEQEMLKVKVKSQELELTNKLREYSCELKNVKLNRNVFMMLLYGRKITNNWIKMHGGIMTRKENKK